ncbi:hypothetical protein E2C01_022074 [Portunus trituberculatus]|uniref:Uncharacterized protein n=1 Tax=Portunus trituberculatus TaxID=210409 RepID=A0A5B7E4A2_PORTR|nr:hypothetical protein [Portunus trituberculatus]
MAHHKEDGTVKYDSLVLGPAALVAQRITLCRRPVCGKSCPVLGCVGGSRDTVTPALYAVGAFAKA